MSQAQGEPDIQGHLGSITLTDILQLLGNSGQTGTLTLTQGWNGRIISYEDGRLCYVSAVTRLPDAADLLAAAGRIDDRAAAAARTQHSQHPDMTLEAVLKAMQLASDADLAACYNQQIEEVLYTFFLWRECRFSFRSGTPVQEGGMPIDLSAEHLILEGVRLVDEWIDISPVIPSIRMTFRRTDRVPPSDLDAALRTVYAHVNSTADVASLARICGITQYSCAKALYHLHGGGFVEAEPPNKAKSIQLFNLFVESIYTKLGLFGYTQAAREFMEQLNAYSREHHLKVRMRNGKIDLDDMDLQVAPTELIDRYRTFLAVQINKFERTFDPTVVRGLVAGLYTHLPPDLQALMGVYDFVRIEGLFDQLRATSYPGGRDARTFGLVHRRE